MVKLPQFAFKIMIDDAPVTVRFKSIGDPKNVKILFTPPTKANAWQTIAPLPKDEVLNWGSFAKQVYIKEESNVQTTDARVPLQSSPTKNGGNQKPKRSAGLLQSLRSAGNEKATLGSSVPAPATNSVASGPHTTQVRHALPGLSYRTAGKNSYPAHYEGPGRRLGSYNISVYYPVLREWKQVEVPGDYPLILEISSKETSMSKTATKKGGATPAPSARLGTNSPVAKSEKGQGVYEAWGQAFALHGATENAPEKIIAYMTAAFPGRKTNWAKWVNPVRARYNAGKLPGVPAPAQKIKSYKFNVVPARTGKDRRSKPKK